MSETKLFNDAKSFESGLSNAVRRPEPRIERLTADPAVSVLTEKPKSIADKAEYGRARRAMPLALEEILEMEDRVIRRESPRAVETISQRANDIADSLYKEFVEAYGDMPERNVQDVVSIDLSRPEGFVQASTRLKDVGRVVTKERFKQRIFDGLNDLTGKIMSSAEGRRAALKIFTENLKKGDYSFAERYRLKKAFIKKLEDPKTSNAISRDNLFEVYDNNNNPLFTLEDWTSIKDIIPEQKYRQIQADSIANVVSDIATDMQARKIVEGLGSETYRFYFEKVLDEDGNVIGYKVPDEAFGNEATYAENLAKRVLAEGEVPPVAIPFKPEALVTAIRNLNPQEIGVTQKRLDSLANYIDKKFTSGQPLAEQLGRAMNPTQFRGTEEAVKLGNLHINRGALSSIQNHLDMLNLTNDLSKADILRALAGRAKTGLVAESLKSLVNNDMSNAILVFIKHGGAINPVDFVNQSWRFKKFLDGDTQGMSAADVQMYNAFNKTNARQANMFSRDMNNSGLFKTLSENFRTIEDARIALEAGTDGRASKLGEIVSKPNDLIRQAYVDLGDMPFRTYEMAKTYKDLVGKLDSMSAGSYIDVNATANRMLRLQKTPSGAFNVYDLSGKGKGPNLVKTVAAGSDDLARIVAENANVIQERLFFDYGRMGNWGKFLKKNLGPFSGIFSWYFKSLDIPFVKRGLLSEMMAMSNTYLTNDPAVLAAQYRQNAGLATRRAMLSGVARSQYDDDEESRVIRRSLSFNPAQAAIQFAMSEPGMIRSRDLSVISPIGSTLAGIGLAENLLNRIEYSHVLKDPAFAAEMLKPINTDVAKTMTKEELVAINNRKRQLVRLLNGQDVSKEQVLNLLGLAAGPIVGILERYKEAKKRGKEYTSADLLRDFSKAMFGSTMSSLADVGLATAGELGSDFAQELSSYGKQQVRRGFKGGTMDPDIIPLLDWSLKQILGLGWAHTVYDKQSGMVDSSGRQIGGRLDSFLNDAKSIAKSAFKNEFDNRDAALNLKLSQATSQVERDEIKDDLKKSQKSQLIINKYLDAYFKLEKYGIQKKLQKQQQEQKGKQ